MPNLAPSAAELAPPSNLRRHGDYLIVVPVRFRRTGPTTAAGEGAFCEHLRALLRELAPRFTRLTLASPEMDAGQYDRQRDHLGTVDELEDGIRWVPLQPAGTGRLAFWLWHFPAVVARLWREVRRADIVHTSTSHNLFQPIELVALCLSFLLGRKSVCVVDIDLREEARMNRAVGRWNRRNYLLCRFVYDPLRSLQLHLAARWCPLVLLKGRRFCRDYGRGRPQVKYFLDAAFSEEHLIPPQAWAHKARALADPKEPLELVYFGRLTAYKGVDRCIRAVAHALEATSARLRLRIIGAGEEEANLRALVRALGLQGAVTFEPALPFGPELFAALYPSHLQLAAPLSEDTPRSALDALACGIPILAFGTAYYSDLAASGAVELVPWPSVERLGDRIAEFARDKRVLLPRARAAVEFARANTQELWLRTRAQWTLALFDASSQDEGARNAGPFRIPDHQPVQG